MRVIRWAAIIGIFGAAVPSVSLAYYQHRAGIGWFTIGVFHFPLFCLFIGQCVQNWSVPANVRNVIAFAFAGACGIVALMELEDVAGQIVLARPQPIKSILFVMLGWVVGPSMLFWDIASRVSAATPTPPGWPRRVLRTGAVVVAILILVVGSGCSVEILDGNRFGSRLVQETHPF